MLRVVPAGARRCRAACGWERRYPFPATCPHMCREPGQDARRRRVHAFGGRPRGRGAHPVFRLGLPAVTAGCGTATSR
ncbi:hypothetical protein DA2_2539 [Desulfovibrio sp. A2]|nr:hypothetical protein DA2_2539 [Desulfovibrio sp. A2]